jgi:hypothetical protein
MEGLLEEGVALESTGGRKATAVMFTENARFALGTEITLNHISIVPINLASEIIEYARIEKAHENTPVYYRKYLIPQQVVIFFCCFNKFVDRIFGEDTFGSKGIFQYVLFSIFTISSHKNLNNSVIILKRPT